MGINVMANRMIIPFAQLNPPNRRGQHKRRKYTATQPFPIKPTKTNRPTNLDQHPGYTTASTAQRTTQTPTLESSNEQASNKQMQ
ncbi:hypothetical protein VTJ04DRAFT_5856 [Mycothermus thermophilus]|uniref:uncharacterized protein n=1 Tax=Humicola insolens TaxID=85995 RepID=UPI003743D94C